MSAWQTYRIGDLGRIVTGRTPPVSQPEMFCGNIPFLTPTDMSDDRRHVITGRAVSTAWDPKGRVLLPMQSICVVCIGATIGKICMTKEPTHTNQQVNSIIVDTGRFDPHFVYYTLRLKVGELKSRAAGAATPIINKTVFSNVTLELPDLATQRRIAAILVAYDDLIEINQQRVLLLEGMSRGLFNEWFIRFRFPGHEAATIVETTSGPIPTGWQMDALGNVADINARSMRPSDAPDRIGYIDIASVSPGQVDDVTWMAFVDAPNRARRIVRDGSILWSNVRPNRRSFAYLVNPLDAVVASTGFTVIDAASVPSSYLYAYLTTDSFVAHLVNRATGAAYPAVTASVFSEALVMVPSTELLRAFDLLAAPSLRMAASLRASNRCLADARNLLLPSLISGEISLTTAERQLRKAA